MPLMHQLSAEKGQDLDRWSNRDWKGGAWPYASLWNGVGRSQRGAGGRSEEDNPQAAMKAAAVGVTAWHCRGFLLLCCGYQQKSASPES